MDKMKLRVTRHAQMRMKKYGISRKMVRNGIENPDNVAKGHSDRKIAQKKIDNHILRIICEKEKNTCVIVTVYKARRGRYEI